MHRANNMVLEGLSSKALIHVTDLENVLVKFHKKLSGKSSFFYG